MLKILKNKISKQKRKNREQMDWMEKKGIENGQTGDSSSRSVTRFDFFLKNNLVAIYT